MSIYVDDRLIKIKFIVSIDKNIFSPNQGISLKLAICKIHENSLMASHIDKKNTLWKNESRPVVKEKKKGYSQVPKGET